MISRRALEIATAVLTGAFGAAILVSSIASGVGWTARGVGSGTFPAISGALIVAGSLYNLVRGALAPGASMLDGAGLRKIGAVFLPAVVFVAAIPFLGLHVASGAYVFGTVAMKGRAALGKAVALALATPVALYATFDWMFQVALPHGMLGAALGF